MRATNDNHGLISPPPCATWQFNYEQSKLRSEIRVKEGRAKPIDILAQNLNLTEDFDVEVNEPYKIFKVPGGGG